MDIYIHIKGNDQIRLAWPAPFLPRGYDPIADDDRDIKSMKLN